MEEEFPPRAGGEERASDDAESEAEGDGTRWELEEGDEITAGRYAIERLGGGHSYEAYLAWDDDLFSLVVVKLLRPHLVEDSSARRSLEKEGAILERLAHPVVVRGFGLFMDDERPHLMMEHLEGPNLSSLIRHHGALPLEQLLPLTVQMCSALHYLEAQDVVHLDVKPRNIIMGAPPRLIDFSVARSSREAHRIVGPVGTDAYMAPEQCDPGLAPIGPAADVWGLGATLYHATAASLPFPRAAEFQRDELKARFPQLHREPGGALRGRDVPPLLGEIVYACLDKNPEKRPKPADVVETIEPLVAGLPRKPVLRRFRPKLKY